MRCVSLVISPGGQSREWTETGLTAGAGAKGDGRIGWGEAKGATRGVNRSSVDKRGMGSEGGWVE